MMKWVAVSALALVGACATQSPYGPATRDGGAGYSVMPIENNRFRITYTDKSAEIARSSALRRAAELTLERGAKPDNPDAYDASDVLSNLGGV